MEMSILKKAAELFSPNDPELVEKTLARLSEQDTWNDVFSTKLIDLLDNIDRIKAEVRQSSRTAEQLGADAKKSFDDSAARLKHACDVEEKATAVLREARQYLLSSETNLRIACERTKAAEGVLAKALELLSDARVRDARALSRLRTTTLWAISAIAFSWIGLVWAAWLALRIRMPVWTACAATACIGLIAILISYRNSYES
jgi:predicted nucleotide-binding protein (sugar kinase/HSP70/actin superfamily)